MDKVSYPYSSSQAKEQAGVSCKDQDSSFTPIGQACEAYGPSISNLGSSPCWLHMCEGPDCKP